MSDGCIKEFQMAVFTAAYSNYRWARLFPKQNTGCFLEAHAAFFKQIKGNHRTVVYDNTTVVVGKFVGHTEKEPTEHFLNYLYTTNLDLGFAMLIVAMKRVMLKEVLNS